MKKLILLTFLQFCLCSLFAQTDVSTALDLQVGTNSYDLTGQSGYVTLYYKYTAPAESGQLLTFTTVKGEGLSYVMSEDGTNNKMIYGINSATGSIVPVKAGQTVYLILNTRGGSEISFDMKAENAIVEGGQTKEEAIDVTGQSNFFIPSNYSTETYSSVTYLKYECSEEGVLEMTFTGSLSGLSVCEENSSEETSVSLSYVSGTVVGKTEVEAGKVYIIKIKASTSPLIGNFVITHPTLGSSSDYPFEGKAVDNELPAEIGKYWYDYVATENGFVMLKSESYLYGGTVSVYDASSMYSPIATVDGCFLARFNVVQGRTYLICIEKNETTSTPDYFDMTFAAAGEGDSFDNPMAINLGENTLPDYNGTYYYKVEIPGEAETSKFLKVTSDAEMLSSETKVSIYEQTNMYSPLASGTKDVKAEVKGGAAYIICWNLDEDINGFKYNVAVEDIGEGEVYSNPIQAVVGTNNLDGVNDKYFSYTATMNGWLVITPSDPTIKVEFPIVSGTDVSYRTAVQSGSSVKTEIVKGTEYIIKLSGLSGSCSFDLEEVGYAEGESRETAIVVDGMSVDVPVAAQTTWFKYVATADGMLEVSSDINYENNASYQSSTVRVWRETGSSYVDITKSSSGGTSFYGEFIASEGEAFYVEVVTLSAQEGKKVMFNLRDFEPGETSDNPIELTIGENTLKSATRQNPVWYYADLDKGELKITADASNYYMMSVYKSDDLNTVLATSNYVSGSAPDYIGSYELSYEVETPGRYIMKLEQTNPIGAVVTVTANIATGISGTGMAAERISAGAGCISVTPSAEGASVYVYDLTGKLVSSAYIKGQTTFNVEKGLYVVKVDNKAVKVVVNN